MPKQTSAFFRGEAISQLPLGFAQAPFAASSVNGMAADQQKKPSVGSAWPILDKAVS
jgi:hypothetical protein